MSYFTVLLVSISQRTVSMQQNAWKQMMHRKVKMADLNRYRAGLEPCLPFNIWNISECVAKKGNSISLSQKSVSNNIRYEQTKAQSRKEVFQPHLPVRLPCYDLAPITSFALGRSLRSRTSGTPGFHGLTGGVYKARERIHRAMADARLLANPASWGRVADPSPNWDRLSRFDAICITPSLCTGHCNTCVAPDVRAVLIWRHPHLPQQ